MQVISDRLLEAKGLTRTDQPALRFSIRYESSGNGYELRALSLNVFRPTPISWCGGGGYRDDQVGRHLW